MLISRTCSVNQIKQFGTIKLETEFVVTVQNAETLAALLEYRYSLLTIDLLEYHYLVLSLNLCSTKEILQSNPLEHYGIQTSQLCLLDNKFL